MSAGRGLPVLTGAPKLGFSPSIGRANHCAGAGESNTESFGSEPRSAVTSFKSGTCAGFEPSWNAFTNAVGLLACTAARHCVTTSALAAPKRRREAFWMISLSSFSEDVSALCVAVRLVASSGRRTSKKSRGNCTGNYGGG